MNNLLIDIFFISILPALMAQITLLHSSKYADSDGDKNFSLLNVIVLGQKTNTWSWKVFYLFTGYGKTVSHVVIGLKTAKGTKQLKASSAEKHVILLLFLYFFIVPYSISFLFLIITFSFHYFFTNLL